MEAPFRCPLDFLGPVHVLDEQRVAYRNANFLDLPQVGEGMSACGRASGSRERGTGGVHSVSEEVGHAGALLRCATAIGSLLVLVPSLPQVPAAVKRSRAVVHIAEAQPEEPFPNPAHTMGHAATLWPGISQAALLQALAPFESLAILELRCVAQGTAAARRGSPCSAAATALPAHPCCSTFFCPALAEARCKAWLDGLTPLRAHWQLQVSGGG
jgi:hypothetical protein